MTGNSHGGFIVDFIKEIISMINIKDRKEINGLYKLRQMEGGKQEKYKAEC